MLTKDDWGGKNIILTKYQNGVNSIIVEPNGEIKQ
jgi:hypothetical protein